MQLSTPVHANSLSFKLGYQHSAIVIGSCFATNIGERLSRLKLPVLVNPFGVVYNPVSIANSIELLLGARVLSESDLFYSNGLWHSFYHHSTFSLPGKDDTFQRIKTELECGKCFLQKADSLAITLGTARVYEYSKTAQAVSNCHKLPASEFTHRLMDVDEVYRVLLDALLLLRKARPQLKVLFTVSPIRHIKDGAHGNQLSKAVLLLAVDKLCQNVEDVAYFPAYEIMMDELRDYRFYAEDMLHPSAVAVEYIWQKFSAAALDNEAQELIPELEKVLQARSHRPFNPNGEEHKTFKASFLSKVKNLKKRYPFLNLDEEMRFFDEN